MTTRLLLDLPDPEATEALARVMAAHLGPGDPLLLSGPIGAGKSHLARALIRARLGNPAEEVPSPTFTLVQTYPGHPEIWHADLYRLSHPDEVLELGLEAAFETAICLVEWPDRLGKAVPADAIRVELTAQGEGRRAEIAFAGRAGLAAALRSLAGEAFLRRLGWQAAKRAALAGDASGRSLVRLVGAGKSAVLVDNPPGLPDRLEDFVRMDRHLRGIGLSAPEILGLDADNGFVLLEDFGDAVFARHLQQHPDDEDRLYALAVDVLIALQGAPALPGLPDLAAEDWAEAAMLSVSQYAAALGPAPDPGPLRAALAAALRAHGDGPRVLIHRDYFAGNLMLLPREGLAAVGLIDFQLGQMGQPVYDLVSLLQDARRDLAPGLEDRMKARFRAARDVAGFEAAYAVWGAQRALRILGVFARQARVEGRDAYLPYLPRVMRDLRRNLAHPALAELRGLCAALLPDPTPAALMVLRSQCGAFR